MGEECDHTVRVISDVEGVHTPFVHEEDGVAVVVEYVVDEGTEGCSFYSFVGGGRAECSGSADRYDSFRFLFDG